MKLATIALNTSSTAVLVVDDQMAPVRHLPGREGATDLLPLIRDPLTPQEVEQLYRLLCPQPNIHWLPPIIHPPKNMLCVGKNYREHVQEGARAEGMPAHLPSHPIWFSKAHTALVGCGDPIHAPGCLGEALDYEGELAVVMGCSARYLTPETALACVFGYTILNDVTARNLQQQRKQWLVGKSADSFAPCGPVVVTADQIPDYRQLRIRTWVNQELRQDELANQMLFDLPTLLTDITQSMTLEPGDIIATGTPAGVGWGMDPPCYLREGDTVSIEIEPIGILSNKVVLSANI
ncbi:MAG: fumarylacetoacetate hydrolase family protein [Cyanobacteriota bacterium]|nr:fumarylacetoacetate hydrolase family protein [Cyanobacteriota bacterium]